MTGFMTRGQTAAVDRLEGMLAAGVPHALLLSGPQSVGKTTLGLDLAAALLCTAEPASGRPCRTCRSCRLVGHGNHPDLHRLAPDGPGAAIGIDAVRTLIRDLALLPAEGGARVALIEAAHRLTEDAQNALLKTLEEPPAGVTIILAVEDEDRLLPTILSRVARVRLGTLSVRAIEGLLDELGEADAPTAARAARLAGGRPGIAIAYARSPEAAALRSEIALTLVDLLDSGRANRLIRGRELLARAAELAASLGAAGSGPATADAGSAGSGGRAPGAGRSRSARSGSSAAASRTQAASRSPGTGAASAPAATAQPEGASDGPGAAGDDAPAAEAGAAAGPPARGSPAERRRAAAMLLEVWRDVARDLALLELGGAVELRQPDLLEELGAAVRRLGPDGLGAFLVTLDRTAQLLDANANPELVADVLVLAWPRLSRAA